MYPNLKTTLTRLYFGWVADRGEVLTAARVAELYLAKYGEPAAEVLEYKGIWYAGPRPEPSTAAAELECELAAEDAATAAELEQEYARDVAAGWLVEEIKTDGAGGYQPHLL